jgi:hypothetical protein
VRRTGRRFGRVETPCLFEHGTFVYFNQKHLENNLNHVHSKHSLFTTGYTSSRHSDYLPRGAHLLPKTWFNFGLQELVDGAKFNAEGDEVGVGHGRRSVKAAVLGVCRVLIMRQSVLVRR